MALDLCIPPCHRFACAESPAQTLCEALCDLCVSVLNSSSVPLLFCFSAKYPLCVFVLNAFSESSRLPTMSLSLMAGGGTLPSSRRGRRHLLLASRVPARSNGAHVAVWRQAPVFPLSVSAEISPTPPNKKGDPPDRPCSTLLQSEHNFPVPTLHSFTSALLHSVLTFPTTPHPVDQPLLPRHPPPQARSTPAS
jgi:hypothetical protein